MKVIGEGGKLNYGEYPEEDKEEENTKRYYECNKGEGGDYSNADYWQSNEGEMTRHHVLPRRNMFTPFRVSGSLPARDIYSVRVTEGVFETGEPFRLVDSWKNRHLARQELIHEWTGRTTFFMKPRFEE